MSDAAEATRADRRRSRVALTTTFTANGVSFGSFVPRIPEIKDALVLSESGLGAALLFVGLGALVAMVATGAATARWGSRVTVLAGTTWLFGALPLISVAGSLPALAAALLAFGIGNGMVDVSQNAHAVVVERRIGRPVMSSFHAAFSLGFMVSALGSGALAQAGVSLGWHLLGISALAFMVVVPMQTRWLVRDRGVPGHPVLARPSRRLVALCAIAFVALLCEGAVSDWAGVYVVDDLDGSALLAGAAVACFSLGMATGRLAGDTLRRRFRLTHMVALGAVVAASGFVVGLAIERPTTTLIALTLFGVGVSIIFPSMLTLAELGGQGPPGPSLAAVATVGYTGLLAGPALIGFLASGTSLPIALAVLPIALAATAPIALRLTAPSPGIV